DALRSGYAGLRLSGNTFWLESKDWKSFTEYEARVHQAFHGRRVVALCSYALSKCGPDEVIDVLRNHGSALVHRDGEWQTIQNATALLSSNREQAMVRLQQLPSTLVEAHARSEIANLAAASLEVTFGAAQTLIA